MNTASMSIVTLVVILVATAAVALACVYLYRKRQSQRLKTRFGAEYNRTLRQFGNQSRGEAELRRRETRVEEFTIRPLTPDEAARFSQAWNILQGRFVDNPKGTVAEADKLVTELMTARGYPMSDFERRASDISVDHPAVVESYRTAQAIAVKDSRGAADTEELRKAIVHYRTLFADLLEVPADQAGNRTPQHVAVQQS